MLEFLSEAWPWYVAGPLIGLFVPLLLWLENKKLGISSNFRHICAACLPASSSFFKYDWRAQSWNLLFVFGIVLGGFISVHLIGHPEKVNISQNTINDLKTLGIEHTNGLLPAQIFSVSTFYSWFNLVFIIIGGFLIGFGTRYAAGCTSGHAIAGLSNLQWPSLVAVLGFFAGGLLMTHIIFPIIF